MKRNGFTLLEVLVSVAILGFIMALVQTTTSQLLNGKERIEHRDQIVQMARVAITKLHDDIELAFLTRKQTPARPLTFFIGEDHGERDALRLTTLSQRRLYRDSRDSDQARVAYQVVPSPEDTSRFDVMRTAIPWLNDQSTVEGGKAFAVARGIRTFDVEYYDVRTEEWKKEWNTEQVDWSDKLPVAVRVSLTFPDPDSPEDPSKDIPFQTEMKLFLAAAPVQ